MLHKRTLRQFTPILALALCLCLPAHATTDLHKDLIWAVEDINATDLARMLKRGADPNIYDTRGNTLLMIAVQNKSSTLVHLLLEAGANPNVRNESGGTDLSLALSRDHFQATEILRNSGATH